MIENTDYVLASQTQSDAFLLSPLPSHSNSTHGEAALFFLPSHSQSARMTLEHYWQDTSLGRPKDWPSSLKISLSNMFGSADAQCMVWGREQYFFYNDAFAQLFSCILASFPYCGAPLDHWPEQWGEFSFEIEECLQSKKPFRQINRPFYISDSSRQVHQYFTYSATPLLDAYGVAKGCLLSFTETSSQVVRERRLVTLYELASETAYATSPSYVLHQAAQVLKRNSEDFAFVLLLTPKVGGQWYLRDWAGFGEEPVERECRLDGEWSNKLVKGIEQSKIAFHFFRDIAESSALFFVKLWGEDGQQAACLGFGLPHYYANGLSGEYEDFIMQVSRQIEASLRGAEAYVRAHAEQISYREQLEQSRAQLEASVQAANDANRLKTSFLANMSHEIRTPLSAILGYSELLHEARLSNVETEYLSIINKNGHALSHLVDDILDLSKVEAGKLSIEPNPFVLMDLIAEVKALFEMKASIKGLFFSVSVRADVPRVIVSDRGRVRQILINVIGNALKFTQRGGVTIEILRKGHVEGNKFKLHIQVTDTGVGLSDKQRDQLFQPFVQLDHTMAGNYGGTGLGLALSRRLTRALGGDLTIEGSALGEGCTFVIALTTAIACENFTALTDKPHKTGMPGGKVGQLKDVQILVVDDSPDNRFLLTRMLKHQGAIIVEAADGLDAVDQALSHNCDIVLMDIQMPRMDGFGALAELRARNFHKPIIALTAHAMKEEREKMLKAGFDGHVAKPVNQALLFENILKLLS